VLYAYHGCEAKKKWKNQREFLHTIVMLSGRKEGEREEAERVLGYVGICQKGRMVSLNSCCMVDEIYQLYCHYSIPRGFI
jgi:hypothetical protein